MRRNTLRYMRQLLFLVILLPSIYMGLLSSVSQAQDAVYGSANGPLNAEVLAPHISYILDASWELTIEDIVSPENTRFKPIPTIRPDFGYIDEKIWLRIKLKNTTNNVENWRLYVRENFLQYYDVYVLRTDGGIEQIESQDPDSSFSDRAFAYPELVTPLKFTSNEEITLYINYWSGGSSYVDMSLETQDSFAALSLKPVSYTHLTLPTKA